MASLYFRSCWLDAHDALLSSAYRAPADLRIYRRSADDLSDSEWWWTESESARAYAGRGGFDRWHSRHCAGARLESCADPVRQADAGYGAGINRRSSHPA